MLDEIESVILKVKGLDDHLGSGDRIQVIIDHESLDANVREPDEFVESVHVVLPVLGERVARRELLTAELDGDLEAVRGQVVKVLHATAHRIPVGAVGDAVREVVWDHVALDLILRGHVGVQVRKEQRNVPE